MQILIFLFIYLLVLPNNVFATVISIYSGTSYRIFDQLPFLSTEIIYGFSILATFPVYIVLYRKFQQGNSFFFKSRKRLLVLLIFLFVLIFFSTVFSSEIFNLKDLLFLGMDNFFGFVLLFLPYIFSTLFFMRKSAFFLLDKIMFSINTLIISSWVFALMVYLIVFILFKLFYKYPVYYQPWN